MVRTTCRLRSWPRVQSPNHRRLPERLHARRRARRAARATRSPPSSTRCAASGDYDVVIATRDWHPADHSSFAEQGGPWPVHCVAGTQGAQLHPDLDRSPDRRHRRQGPGRRHRRLQRLRRHRPRGAPARARHHAADGRRAGDGLLRQEHRPRRAARGLRRHRRRSAVRGVEVEPGDSERALAEVRAAGGVIGVNRRPADRQAAGPDLRRARARGDARRPARPVRAQVARRRGVGQRPPADRRRPDDLAAARRRPHVRAAPAARPRAHPRRRHRLGLPRGAAGEARRARVDGRAPRRPVRAGRRRTSRAAGVTNVTVVVGDGARGLPETAPFDAINVAAAAGDDIPRALEDQLGMGARLVVPVEHGDQRLFVVQRTPHGLERKGLERVRFVPLVTVGRRTAGWRGRGRSRAGGASRRHRSRLPALALEACCRDTDSYGRGHRHPGSDPVIRDRLRPVSAPCTGGCAR